MCCQKVGALPPRWAHWQRRGIASLASVVALLLMVAGLMPRAVHAATGDWTAYLMDNDHSGYNSAETAINPSTAPNLKLHWTYPTGGKVFSQPIVASGMVYVGSFNGYEYAFNTSGAKVWSTNLGTTVSACHGNSFGVVSSPTAATVNGTPTLFVGGGNGQVYALNAATGAVIWSTRLGTSPSHFVWSSPTLYSGSIYIGVASLDDCPLVQGQMVQLNAVDGTIQHIFNTVPNGCLGAGVWGSATIDDATGMLYFATGNPGSCATSEPYSEAVVELNAATLSFVGAWQVPQKPGDLDFGSTPTLFVGTVAGAQRSLVGIANKNGIYYTFDRTKISAGPVWARRISAPGNPEQGNGDISPSAWDGTNLYAAGGRIGIGGVKCAGSLQALNPGSGALIWRLCIRSGAVLGAVTAVPGLVFVGAGNSILVVGTTGSNAGKVLYTFKDSTTGSKFEGPASVSNGVIYEGNWDGKVEAVGL